MNRTTRTALPPLPLLDRLIDEPLPGDQVPQPRQVRPGSNGGPDPGLRLELVRRDLARLRFESILRDLEVLLNTRRSLVCLPEAPGELSRSILDYGLAAPRGSGPISAGHRESLRREIESAIQRFEPRLVNVRIVIEAESSPLERLRLRIDAFLAGTELVSFQASIESQRGRFELRGNLP
jgi:type VI secretion system protein ImpF